MAIVRLQSDYERQKHLYYEFDPTEKPLGEGGMGKVYKGHCVDERTGMARDVAIKFIFSEMPEHVIERARREASVQLRNDNLVEMLSFIEIDGKGVLGETKKRYHVVSELLEGVMLDDLLQGKTTDQNGVPIPFAEKLYRDYQNQPFHFATFVVRNILSGVMALHDAGYIHRDIDPTNIMVTRDEHIKLIDFGIAKQLNLLNTQDKALTSAGMFIGKPWYAAPELVLGDVKHQNQTTDIYAIGILFFQLYLGQRPFEGANHEVLDMQLHKPMPLKAVSRKDLRAIIAKATNKKQELRYQSAAEFRVDIDKLFLKPMPTPYPWGKWAIYATGGSALVAAAISIGVILREPQKEEEEKVIGIPYYKAVSMLKTKETAAQGLSALDSLSNEKEYNATYLLSRLYFDTNYKKECDHIPDTITQLQQLSGIKPDYQKANELLIKAVSINPHDYNSLYALGCEYLIGDRSTLGGRNLQESKNYLDKALKSAKESNAKEFVQIVEKLKDNYKSDFDKEGR